MKSKWHLLYYILQKINLFDRITVENEGKVRKQMNDYIFQTDHLFFKHEISENLPCDTYSMHIHNGYELIYFVDGDATHVIEDKKYKLKKGDLILIRPMQYHFIQIDSISRYERYNILFDPKKYKIDGLKLLSNIPEIINLEENAIAKNIFHRLDIYHQNCDEDMFNLIMPHLLSELFYNLRIFSHTPPKESSSLSPLISKVLQYINANLCSVGNVHEIANHFFVSESYLFGLFKKELHHTPKKYIREKRLLMAQKMLSEGENPTRVSERCGFDDYTTFYRNYTSFFGYSPKQTPHNDFPAK